MSSTARYAHIQISIEGGNRTTHRLASKQGCLYASIRIPHVIQRYTALCVCGKRLEAFRDDFLEYHRTHIRGDVPSGEIAGRRSLHGVNRRSRGGNRCKSVVKMALIGAKAASKWRKFVPNGGVSREITGW